MPHTPERPGSVGVSLQLSLSSGSGNQTANIQVIGPDSPLIHGRPAAPSHAGKRVPSVLPGAHTKSTLSGRGGQLQFAFNVNWRR